MVLQRDGAAIRRRRNIYLVFLQSFLWRRNAWFEACYHKSAPSYLIHGHPVAQRIRLVGGNDSDLSLLVLPALLALHERVKDFAARIDATEHVVAR